TRTVRADGIGRGERAVHQQPPGCSYLLPVALFGSPAWMRDALCAEHPEVNWFPERGESTVEAKRLCGRCLVQRECREYALGEAHTLVGIWGGTSQRDRRRLRSERVAEPAA